MSKFDVKNNKSICVLPWIHEFKSVGGHTAPCCVAKSLKNKTMADIRAEMLADKKPSACNICYKSEKESNWSHRLDQTHSWINRHGEPDINNPTIEYVDIRFDPTCNLKCKTCNPGSSTLWQKEKGVKFTINQENYKDLAKVNKKQLKKVYMAGGEPTYISLYYIFLNELKDVNPDCEVIINTNLKRLPDPWKNIMKSFKNFTVICSCDAIHELGSYVRYPLGWDQFEENVKFASTHANFFTFNMVCSNLTVHKIFETCSWMKQYSKNISLEILDKPEIFSEASVPMHERQKYILELKKLRKFPIGMYSAGKFRSNINYLIQRYTKTKYNKQLHQKLKAEIAEQDSHRSINLKQTDAFLYNWIYE